MERKSKYQSTLQKIALSCDSFTTGYFAVSLLFAVWYVYMYGGVVVLGFLPLAILVSFAVMPLIYLIVHRVDVLLFGRYHLVMPISALMAALFFVILYSSTAPDAGGAASVFFGTLLFVPSVMTYRYCAISVRTRLMGDGVGTSVPYAAAFSVLGAVCSVVTFFGFWHYDGMAAFLNTAYVMGGACILLAVIGYLTTYYGIPQLGGRRVQSVKSVFRTFFVGLNKRTYFSALLFLAAFAAAVMTNMLYALVMGLGYWEVFAIAIVFVVCYAASSCACYYFAAKNGPVLFSVDFVCLMLGALIPAVIAAVGSGGVVYAVAVSAALCGVGGALSVRQAKIRLATVKPHMTSGVLFMLFELTAACAVAIAFAVCAVAAAAYDGMLSARAFLPSYGVCVVLCAAAFALTFKKRQTPESAPEESLKPDAAEEGVTAQ